MYADEPLSEPGAPVLRGRQNRFHRRERNG